MFLSVPTCNTPFCEYVYAHYLQINILSSSGASPLHNVIVTMINEKKYIAIVSLLEC